MLISHRFGSVETLARAQTWLTHHGFEVVKSDEPSHDVARLTLNVNFSKAAAALALIDSIENSDPEGWPGNTTPTRSLHGPATANGPCVLGHRDSASCSPICWLPRDESSPVDPVSSRVRDYMFSRWE